MPEGPLVPPELLEIVDYFHPRREAGPDGDIDLLVIFDDDAPSDRLTLRMTIVEEDIVIAIAAAGLSR
jgi:hypothetical protein